MTKKHSGNRRSFISALFFVGGGVILVLAVWILFHDTISPSNLSNPILIFTPKTVQFGSVSQEILHSTAVVTNSSGKQLDIVAVTKGCDCTEVLIEQGQLLPGEQREMSFQWDTHGRRGDTGIVIGVIYKVEDDPNERIAPLTLEATVVPDFEISPTRLKFFSNRSETRKFTLIPVKDSQIKIKDILINHPAFSTTMSSDMLSAMISFDSDKWADGIRYMDIQVVTTSEDEPIFPLPIDIHVE